MRFLSIVLLALIAFIGASTPVRSAAAANGRTIILFGADWCAPCLVELRDLPVLADMAMPDHVRIAWIEGVAASRLRTMPVNVDRIGGEEARRLFAEQAGDAAGLPHAIMIDADGRRCAEWRAPLHPAEMALLKARCR